MQRVRWVGVEIYIFIQHLVRLSRSMSFGIFSRGLLSRLLYLILFAVIFYPVAMRMLHKRLIH
jgi:hypothetical protein